MHYARLSAIVGLASALLPAGLVQSQECDTVMLANGTVVEANDPQFDNKCIVVERASTVTINGEHSFRSVEIEAGATVTHDPGVENGIRWMVEEVVQVDGLIDVMGKGLLGDNIDMSDNAAEAVSVASTCDAMEVVEGAGFQAGASHGGLGGVCSSNLCDEEPSNALYGSADEACLPGSGGGACDRGRGGNGGGVVWIDAPRIAVSGQIRANGEAAPNLGPGGGGSGGSVYLAAQVISGTGFIQAFGGNGAPAYPSGGGGGGRIALDATEEITFTERNLNADGGRGGQDCGAGQVGTIWLRVADGAPTVILGTCNGNGRADAPDFSELTEIGRR